MDIKDLTDSGLKEKFLKARVGDVIKAHYKGSGLNYYFLLVTNSDADKFYLIDLNVLKRIEPDSETSLESLYDSKFLNPEGRELIDRLGVYNKSFLTIK